MGEETDALHISSEGLTVEQVGKPYVGRKAEKRSGDSFRDFAGWSTVTAMSCDAGDGTSMPSFDGDPFDTL